MALYGTTDASCVMSKGALKQPFQFNSSKILMMEDNATGASVTCSKLCFQDGTAIVQRRKSSFGSELYAGVAAIEMKPIPGCKAS